jgi:hypothetical protein
MRRHSVIRLAIAAVISTALAGCGHSHGGAYDTLMECVTDHTGEEGLTEVQALATCLVDHSDVTFTTQAECETYVAANGGYPNSAVMACMIYLQET